MKAHPCRHPLVVEILNGRKRKVRRDSAEAIARYLERVANLDRDKSERSAARRLERIWR